MHSWITRFFVLLLILESGNCHADELDVDVTIENLDFRQPKVTVTYDGRSRELDIAPDSSIEINGRRSDYRSILPGDQAKVTYHRERKLVTKIVIQREFMAPAEKLAEGWEDIDPRLIFLMIRLANVEATLEAIEKATEKKGVRVVTVERDAKRADRANEDMDRNAGGPLKWSQFYGMTAETFFYHPTDRNSSYHTVTVLNQQGYQADNKIGGGVPSSQGLPVHQRPPQFDYIYRANEKARGRAEGEILELRGKLDQLEARRQRLEAEQAGLWVEVAFRAILQYDLDQKPLYRYEPVMLASDTLSRERAEMIKSAATFMSLSLSIISEAEKDQVATFTRIKPAIAEARKSLIDTYLRLALDFTDKRTDIGRFFALAKKIDDVAANLTDSYIVAMEGDSAKDRQRKDLFRAQLQQSLLNYAQIVLAMDEMLQSIADNASFRPNTDIPIRLVGLQAVKPVATLKPVQIDEEREKKENQTASKKPVDIPEDAVYWKGKWYWFPDQKMIFQDAINLANRMNGTLIVIDSFEENEFVRNRLKGPTFLGLMRHQNGFWVNAYGRVHSFFNWAIGQPQNTLKEKLVAFHPKQGWHDYLADGQDRLYVAVQWIKNAKDK